MESWPKYYWEGDTPGHQHKRKQRKYLEICEIPCLKVRMQLGSTASNLVRTSFQSFLSFNLNGRICFKHCPTYTLYIQYLCFHIRQHGIAYVAATIPRLVRHWLPPGMFGILWNKCWARSCFLNWIENQGESRGTMGMTDRRPPLVNDEDRLANTSAVIPRNSPPCRPQRAD